MKSKAKQEVKRMKSVMVFMDEDVYKMLTTFAKSQGVTPSNALTFIINEGLKSIVEKAEKSRE